MLSYFTDSPSGKTCLVCAHSKEWPPKHAYLGMSVDDAYLSGKISERERSVGQIWDRVCRKTGMDLACLNCPHHLQVGCDHLGLFSRNAAGVKARFTGMTLEAWKQGMR